MILKSIEEASLENARVLVRVDFNVEFKNVSEVAEHFRFDIVKKTIDFLAQFPGVKIALLTHLGRPEAQDKMFSTERIISAVEQSLKRKVVFVPDCIGDKVSQALDTLPSDAVLLLENVRFYAEEESNDILFTQKLAEPFSVFVNEAFSACHREHASIVGIPQLLPAYAGFRLIEEVETLDRVKYEPKHPAIAVIGGAKIETKLPLIHAFEENYDAILVGGKIANEALDQNIVFSEKVLLPQDFGSPDRFDIGPKTIAFFIQMIKLAKTVIWNGPMGKFEEKPYDMGTDAILHALLESSAYVVIGGGESLSVLEKADAMNKIGFVSSGGGAMLEFLGGNTLPGLEVLKSEE
ncbi:MAG: phosphoglycerate kinase [Candidatus Moranbacteria bacterium]|nr:phosphoglycerate kinase [Candidatus Moranbacteria bacterium]MDD3964864.1 phosphoglycerate kinase [Candidatus Moranbacteria bacterium]